MAAHRPIGMDSALLPTFQKPFILLAVFIIENIFLTHARVPRSPYRRSMLPIGKPRYLASLFFAKVGLRGVVPCSKEQGALI